MSLLLCLVTDFSATHRSINGTGETLPASETEVGVTDVAYGVTDDWMVRTPSLALLVGYGSFEARHKLQPDDHPLGIDRISPYVSFETPSDLSAGADVGWDFGASHEHSLTAGAKVRSGPLFRSDFSGGAVVKPRTQLVPSVEYDYYGWGSDAYVGMNDYLPYVGYTWAWTKTHAGLIFFPTSGLIPLPYVYWRF